MNLTPSLLTQIRENIAAAKRSPFYAKHFAGIEPGDIQTEADFQKLPFTGKEDLRDAYPLGLCAVPQEEVVRVHSSSGTTGAPVIIPYTQQDVTDWAVMFKRCYETAGVTRSDRVHITPGYGMWTAGIGFQLGEALPPGATGELVITTLRKQGAPLIRYRTHDLPARSLSPAPAAANSPASPPFLAAATTW